MLMRYIVVVGLCVIGCAEPESGNHRSSKVPKVVEPTKTVPKEEGKSETKTGVSPTQDTPIAPEGSATPITEAITVKPGAVRFNLASADKTLQGGFVTAQLTVNPAAGSIPESISLRDLRVESPQSSGVSLVSPSLVVQVDGKERVLPIGKGISMRMPKGRIAPLGGVPAVTFEAIGTGDLVQLRFEALEQSAVTQVDGVPNYRECKASVTFKAVADGLKPCQSCHSGLFSYDFMETDLATACGLNMKLIDRTLGRVPTIPAGAHKGLDTSAVRSAISAWKNAEGVD